MSRPAHVQAVPTPEDPTLAQAISGDYIEILLAQRREIVETLPDVRGAAKAALHRQLTLISKEIEAIRVAEAKPCRLWRGLRMSRGVRRRFEGVRLRPSPAPPEKGGRSYGSHRRDSRLTVYWSRNLIRARCEGRYATSVYSPLGALRMPKLLQSTSWGLQ